MKYVEHINNLIRQEVAKPEHAVIFGQNINAGSCLGGFTRGMMVKPGGKIINATNAENSLVGFGFGLMVGGANAGFFMKQMDFLLLGVDQLVNTYNIIRSIKHQLSGGSFTIMAIVVDSGYEGPQSSLNNFSDFCSIAHIPGFTVTNKADADYIIPKYLMQPGFRIIGISQRLGKTEIIDPEKPPHVINDGAIFRYADGKDATLVSFNLSFPQVHRLHTTLEEKGVRAAHFNVNTPWGNNWRSIVESVRQTKKIIVVDDGKSGHSAADALLAELCATISLEKKIVIKRTLGEDWLHPTADVFEIDEGAIINELL